jgi:hypothetical protein
MPVRITKERQASNIRVTKLEAEISVAILELVEEDEEYTEEEIVLALANQLSTRQRRIVSHATPLETT